MSQPIDIAAHLRAALDAYDDPPRLAASPLMALAVVEAHLPGISPQQSPGSALQKVIEAAIKRLGDTQPYFADLLTWRYKQGQSTLDIALARECGRSTIHVHVGQAQAALANVLMQMEAEAILAARRKRRLANLPRKYYQQLVGMDALLAEVQAALADSVATGGPPLVLTGLGGIGKTSIAREALVRWLSDPDCDVEGVLWAEVVQVPRLDWAEPRVSFALDQVLVALGEQAGLSLAALPSNEQRLLHLTERLAGQRTVVVIDNAETREELDIALHIARALQRVAAVLVTSRRAPAPSSAARSLVLGELRAPDAHTLMQDEAAYRHFGPLDYETRAALFDLLGGHPHALKMAVGLLRLLPLSQVVAELRGSRPSSADWFFTRVYEMSWQLLTPLARRVLLSLMVLPPWGAEWSQLQAAARSDDETLRQTVEALSNLNLLQVSVSPTHRYRIHRLTYHFLARKAGLPEADEETP